MAVNVLETKDLLELSLLKCKVCNARLQGPVLQVAVFGNVCGSCYDRSVFTDVVRNVDLEAFLQKLYLPCNYAKRGCDFEGSFDDVCKHEKRCPLRKKECPLAYYEQCDNDLKYIDDMIDHMKSEHPDNILTAIESYVSVKNPINSNQDVFYLLLVDDMNFMLRARLDVNKSRILYAFYSLNYGLDIEHVKISIEFKYENTFCNVENIIINRLGKGELPYEFNEDEAIKLKLSTLENFECLDSLTVKVNIKKNMEVEQISTKSHETSFFWSECTNCSRFSRNVYYCRRSSAITRCDNCYTGSYCKCGYSFGSSEHMRVNVDGIKPRSIFVCKNLGCNEEISCDNYDLHTKSQCQFRQVKCPFSTSIDCKWEGAYTDLTTHITADHTDRLNQHSCELPNSTASSGQLCFIKGNRIFTQTYQISQNQLVISTKKLDTFDYGDGYKWQIYFKHPIKGYETLISDIFAGDETENSVGIKGFTGNEPFTFKILLRRINTVSN